MCMSICHDQGNIYAKKGNYNEISSVTCIAPVRMKARRLIMVHQIIKLRKDMYSSWMGQAA